MNSSAEDILTLLAADSGLALEAGVDLFYSQQPDEPQNCVTVFDNAGESPMLQLSKARSRYYHPGITVQVRNIDYTIGYDLSFAILQNLHGTNNVTIGDTLYTLISAKADPQLLHWDENRRAVFIVNFEVQRRESNI